MAVQAFDSCVWEAEAGRCVWGVNLECCSLRQGFPFGLALLVQTYQPGLGISCLHLCSVGVYRHRPPRRDQTQFSSF